jgi:prepilin-type processing-associated H-X9-DG protein
MASTCGVSIVESRYGSVEFNQDSVTLPRPKGFVMKQSNRSCRAFTLVEALAIVAVLAIFGALLVPAFAQDNKTRVRDLRCMDNHAQLIESWLMYANDFEDYVANNYTIPGTESAINKWKTTGVCDAWAPNVMTFTFGSAIDVNSTTNTALAQAGLLAPYHQRDIEFYHCPADNFLSRQQKAAGWKSRLRSVGMNSNWGRTDPGESKAGNPASWTYGAPYRQWHRVSEVRKPAERYVFVDEHADSVNDGFFLVNWGGPAGDYPGTSASGMWGDIPGFYHNNATPFGFADGHTELKKWLSRPIPVRADGQFISGRADIRDQQWYVRHVAERF